MDIDIQSHDLALSYLEYTLAIEREGTNAEHSEDAFFERYKEYYNRFHEFLNCGI